MVKNFKISMVGTFFIVLGAVILKAERWDDLVLVLHNHIDLNTYAILCLFWGILHMTGKIPLAPLYLREQPLRMLGFDIVRTFPLILLVWFSVTAFVSGQYRGSSLTVFFLVALLYFVVDSLWCDDEKVDL